MSTEYVLDADKIAHWRIDNHVPLKQLARAAGVNLSSLSHAISNGREVKMNLLLNLAEAMGEDPRDIVRPKALASQETKCNSRSLSATSSTCRTANSRTMSAPSAR